MDKDNRSGSKEMVHEITIERFVGKSEILRSGIMEELQAVVDTQFNVLYDKSVQVSTDYLESSAHLNQALESLRADLDFPHLANIILRVVRSGDQRILGFGITPFFYVDDSRSQIRVDNTFFGVLKAEEKKGLATLLLKKELVDMYNAGVMTYQVSVWEGSENIYKKLSMPYTATFTPMEYIDENGNKSIEKRDIILTVDLSHLPDLPWTKGLV